MLHLHLESNWVERIRDIPPRRSFRTETAAQLNLIPKNAAKTWAASLSF